MLDLRYRALRLPCSEAHRAALRALLDRHGQQTPVLASDAVEPGRLVLLDGFKRVGVLAQLGAPVRVDVVPLGGPAALAVILAANAGRRGPSELEEAWVLEAMQREHGLDQRTIAEVLGRHRSWVCRRLQLLTGLERQVQDDVRLGLLSASAARELVRLPRGNQADVARCAAVHDLTSRQVGRLVTALVRLEPRERRAALDDPLSLARPAPRAAGPRGDPRLSEHGNRLRHELLRLQGATHRLEELTHELGALPPGDLAALRPLASAILDRARATVLALLEALAPAREVGRAS